MIAENVKRIKRELPPGVLLVAAAKTRTPEEILAAVAAGIEIIGENLVQEAEEAFAAVGSKVRWHMIGHLQRNKAKRAVQIFDLIETLDSARLAWELEKRCARIGKVMPVLVEINSGGERQKSGVLPGEIEDLIKEITPLEHLRVQGLMTMGPRFGDPEDVRPYFQETKRLFEEFSSRPGLEMEYLSMGMSGTYKVAIEEGANVVRIGREIFGERMYG